MKFFLLVASLGTLLLASPSWARADHWIQSGDIVGPNPDNSCFQASAYEFMFVHQKGELVGLKIKNVKTGQIGTYAYVDVPSDETYFKPVTDLPELNTKTVVYYEQRNGLIGWQILRNGQTSLILPEKDQYTPNCSK